MSEFKGTKGPWHVSGKAVYAIGGDGSNRFSALVDDARTSERELEANARLIAAAPEMLEALTYLVDMAGGAMAQANNGYDIYDIDEELADARSAIAKAIGEPVK